MESQILIHLIYLMFTLPLLLNNVIGNLRKEKASILMNRIFIGSYCKIIFAVLEILVNGKPEFDSIHLIFLCGEFGMGVPILFSYIEYIKELVHNKTLISNKLIKVIHILGTIIVIIDILSVFYPLVFYVENGVYQRGVLFNLYHLLFVILFPIVWCIVFRARAGLSKRYFYCMQLYIIAPCVGVMLQIIIDTMFDFVTLGVTLGMITVYTTFYIERDRLLAIKERELIDQKIATMFSQIQPHFLYNSLNAIYHLCDQEPSKVQKAIGDFAEYMRENLDSINRTTPVPFDKELKHIGTYLALEKMRFNDELRIIYDIETTEFMVPSLTIQPLIENAVKHGLGHKEEGGTVMISTRECENHFEIKIKDNGVGFCVNEHREDGKSHIGIENVKQRLLNKVGGVLFIESKVGKGTTITIKIPKDNGYEK